MQKLLSVLGAVTLVGPDMTTPSTSVMTQSNLDEKLAKVLTMTINKSLGAEQRPSTSGTSSILNKIDNYLDETETQEDKG
ncbi:hypothetical protein [Spiroplasma phoeniceum]|uniref:Uncharacterized protein n=1 Tax=Spiroplasma phoeniceum P40 TaxID=1276259 RepID=A0A345DRQ2_9MOLU|nr:hypothetical protein [Spiroplasma phoeniceum]AXF96893.1 hypothetical protein SDAV_001951 [Spiroplasma phoeniceum P40]